MTPAEKALAEKRNYELQREINSYPVRIDRKVFQKTFIERRDLKLAKSNFKLTTKKLAA